MKARILIATCVILTAHGANASQNSIGPNGINSDVLDLNGSGVPIGQVEILRPAKPGLDSPGFVNDDIVPTAVFIQDMPANIDDVLDIFDPHATDIAGVMISDHATATGVAPNASLYASAFLPDTPFQRILVALQHVALQAGGDVRVINMSFGTGPVNDPLDGNNQLALFMDWSARQHDVLYVIAGPATGFAAGKDWGVDNYNGMAIASSDTMMSHR